MATGNRGLGGGNGLLDHIDCGGSIGRRRQTHVYPDLGVVGYDIGAIAAFVIINHMKPHNQLAFQTECKPPKRSATRAQQQLPFAG